MTLADSQILRFGPEIFFPFSTDNVQPSSYELHLGSTFTRYLGTRLVAGQKSKVERFTVQDSVVLRPGECLLACTAERVKIPKHLAGFVHGKSSIGRLFVAVHITAGLIDPGFEGQIVLEIKNMNPNMEVELKIGAPICQITLEQMDGMVKTPYGSEGLGSHYQGQSGPQEALWTQATTSNIQAE